MFLKNKTMVSQRGGGPRVRSVRFRTLAVRLWDGETACLID